MSVISNELLGYEYRDETGEGVAAAVQLAGQWLQEIFQEPWWPDGSARHVVHRGGSASCDAVAISYRAGDASGPLEITVFQTVFYIVVAVIQGTAGKLDPGTLGRRIFNHPERLQLTVLTQQETVLTGRQASNGVPYGNYDWLDTIQWWSDANLVGFEMLKRTGAGQPTIVRPEREANLTWFARFD